MHIKRRLKLTIAVAAIVAAAIPVTFAFAADGPTATASVVKVENKKAPRTKVVHRKFRPWGAPPARRGARDRPQRGAPLARAGSEPLAPHRLRVALPLVGDQRPVL